MKPLSVVVTILGLFSINACRSSSEQEASEQDEILKHLVKNNLAQAGEGQAQSSLLHTQSQSAIHWQPWSKSVFSDAEKVKKTVFAFIGSGTDPYSLKALDQLNQSQQASAALNSQHVNILVDSNLHPDLEFFTASLCRQSRVAISKPLLVWFSPEGVPISWIPVSRDPQQDVSEFIIRTSNIVSRMWVDSPDYVLKNSREDFLRRVDTLLPSPLGDKDQLLAIRATRQIASLFDPTTSTVDGAGDLSIGRFIELLTIASRHPDLAENQRKRYIQMATLTADGMLLQGLIDPLDGGVYSGIQQSTVALPVFSKNLKSQAYTMSALYRLYQASGEARFLHAADAILAYTEKNLALPDGGYSLGIVYAESKAQDNPCIWKLEELESTLTPEEMKMATLAFGIQGLGNIPMVDDHNRNYFRQNTLTWKQSKSELASSTGMDPVSLNRHLESITKKLAKKRADKSSNIRQEKLSTAEATALISQAYITGYRATGDAKYLDRATKLGTFIQEHFVDDAGALYHARFNGQLLGPLALGADYAHVCQAALDLHEVTLDPAWLQWASDIQQRMTKQLANSEGGFILENEGLDYPYAYNVYQFLTFPALDNASTWGISHSNAKRLSAQKNSDQLQAQYKALEGGVLATTQMAPLTSIDFLTADAKIQQPTVYLKSPVAPELLKVAVRSWCQIIAVSATASEKNQYPELGEKAADIPSQGAIVIQGGQILGTTTEAEELQKILQ